jgi:hypothetical protein
MAALSQVWLPLLRLSHWLKHAPPLPASAIGQTICREPAPLSLIYVEICFDKAMLSGDLSALSQMYFLS